MAMQACRLTAQGYQVARTTWRGFVAPQRRRWLGAVAATPDTASQTVQQEQPPAQQQQQPNVAQQPAFQKPEDDRSPFERLMQHARLTHIAQELWAQVIRPGDTVVDATCGNGHDTLFLAQAVGRGGTVYAFDVQTAAIESTRRHVSASVAAEALPDMRYHLASHAEMLDHVGRTDCASVVVFNLGYLPGGNKACTTEESSTITAVQAACEVLQPGGLISLLCYTGHPGGMEEFEAVRDLVGQLPPSGWVSSEIRLLNRPTAPVLLMVWKRGE